MTRTNTGRFNPTHVIQGPFRRWFVRADEHGNLWQGSEDLDFATIPPAVSAWTIDRSDPDGEILRLNSEPRGDCTLTPIAEWRAANPLAARLE